MTEDASPLVFVGEQLEVDFADPDRASKRVMREIAGFDRSVDGLGGEVQKVSSLLHRHQRGGHRLRSV